LLCCVTVAAGVIPDSEGAGASLRDVLAALDANREMARLAAVLREENARLRAENAEQAAELERVRADLAVLQRMVFGRSSERARPEPSADGGGDAGQGRDLRGSGTGGKKRGPGARAGRRDYSHLPRVEVAWDFGGGGYCCPECGTPFTGLGSDHVAEQLDWLVIVRVRADCRRRYRRACSCRVPATVTAPGPPKAIGKGLFTNAFIAMLFTERFVAGRSMNSLVTGLARHGADVAPGTLAGACAQAGALLAPLWRTRSRRGRAGRGTCTPTRRPGGSSRRAMGTARPGGGCGFSSALIPPASSWTPPGRGPSWPGMRASTRRPGSSPRMTMTGGRGGW
jgi:transposase